MGLDTKANFIGLVTASGEAAAAQGALRIADNVTLRKEGALVCRPSFTEAGAPEDLVNAQGQPLTNDQLEPLQTPGAASTPLSRPYLAAFPYKGSLYYVAADNVVYSPAQAAMTFGGASPPAVRVDIQSAKESRGNLYIASSEGVYKVSATSDTALRGSGMDIATVRSHGYTTNPPTFITTGNQVAYRVVAKHTDPNGLIVRARPSGAYIVQASGDWAITLTIQLPTSGVNTAQPEQVEVYRSRVFPNTVTPDDELQFVGYAVNAGAGTAYFEDHVPDIARGTTLYTSPSRGGVENAADRAPGCACLERYRGSLFFGHTRSPQRVVFNYRRSGNVSGNASGIGYRSYTGTTSNGSAAIVGMSSTVGVQAGQLVTFGTYSGRVTSIVGTTVNITPASNATGAQDVLFHDALQVDGGAALQLGNTGGTGVTPLATTSAAIIAAASGYTAYELTPPSPGYDFTVVLERVRRGGAAFTVTASHQSEINFADGSVSKMDDLPSGLAWSEPDEPEHVPPRNFARVGDHGKAILGLVATRDRLLVFKEDGLYMLTGDTAKNFSIYPLDTTCLCILPGSIRRLKNTVFALTNLGLVAVDENGGVTVVSRPIQTDIAPIVQQIRAAAKANGGLYLMPGLSGTTGAGDDAAGEYWLALGTTSPSFGGQVLVYSMPREGFTTYSFGASTPVALATDGEGQPLALTASALLSPTTTQGAVTARISPRAFSDPALVGKLWTHIVVGLSQLTGTASSSIAATFSGSEAMVASSITELFEGPITGPTMVAPLGTLLRHPVPKAMARAFMLFLEVVITTSNGTFTVELLGAESRENVSNKRPTHGTGTT